MPIPSPAKILRQRRRRAAVTTHREATEGIQTRPAYDLDPAGRLNRDLDTDLFIASPHPHLAPVPATVDLLAETTRRIDALHAAGALDEGSYTVLDHFLDADHHTMDTAAERHARAQLDFLRRAETAEKRTHHETWHTLQTALAALAEAEARLAEAATALTGTPVAPRTTDHAPLPQTSRTPAPGTAQQHHTSTPPPAAGNPAAPHTPDPTADTPPASQTTDARTTTTQAEPGTTDQKTDQTDKATRAA
ncbi:hypothetical protein [Sinomonas humi]|uniref:Uncharacterized protein n=1 Tax=Sinomonas humi TaxID=1338436 RepID=A0A0B2AAV4_9MICC|nr:hypothetical protein [Sinomonas humi]KHL00275.1 hypothetical protein LK10_20620 [Sinomonas humi]